uniref:Uncharacterized protein n=1 Tax=Heterorhabditis bacteriophora TaxID=37862 RepID=A0A1I7X1F5_HETBA
MIRERERMSEDGEKSRSPDDYAQSGLWEVEPLYYNVPGRTDRSRRGKFIYIYIYIYLLSSMIKVKIVM